MTIFRYDMSIPVRVVSALHSGGVDEVPERPITDEDGRTVQPNAFVRNGLGEAILPGRSIKGAIRAAFEEHMDELGFSKEELKSLWGGEMRREVGTGKESLPLRASALTFHHAVVWDRASGDLPHRMSTAIDRATGGAADGALFAYEYLPVDTTFEIRVSAEARDPAPDSTKNEDAQSTTQSEKTKGTPPVPPALVKKALQAVVTLLDGKFISLGGRTGSGWGHIEPLNENAEYKCKLVVIPGPKSETADSTSFLAQVLGKHSSEDIKPNQNLDRQSVSTNIKIEWQAQSGLFVGMNKPDIKSSKEDTVPAAPLRNWHLNDKHRADHGDVTYPKVAHEDKASLLLPGTSIRGALRSHCSRIAHSIVSDSECCEELTMAEDVHKQLAADPLLVRYLFGTTEYRGAVRVHDCEGRISEEEPLKLTRNAIDRVTGSAAHGALYSELLYPHVTWDSIQIDIDHAQLCRNIRQDPGGFVLPDPSSSDKDYELPGFKIRLQAAILLLTMAVTDLCEGVLPLGGGTGGGLGLIEVSRVSFEGLPGKHKSVHSCFKAPTHPEDSHEVHEARTEFARNILTNVISAFTESCPDAASAEHTAINLIRKWIGSESDGDQASSASRCIRPTQVRISWNSPTGVFVHDPQQKTPANKEQTKRENGEDSNVLLPLRVKSSTDNSKTCTDPLLLPGTSIRGALRSRCSRIARTVLYAESGPPEEKSFVAAAEIGNHSPIDIHEQLARDPNLVRFMFGTTEYRGAIRIRDCTTQKLNESLTIPHNAIDRWTGGAVKGALFFEVVYPHASWNDIVIEVDTVRLLQNVKTESSIRGLSLDDCVPFARASWCLLCIALAELSAGTLPLGGKTTRGLGQVEVTGISVSDADGTIITAPAEEQLWPARRGDRDNTTPSVAHTILAYLRGELGGNRAYKGWADCLPESNAEACEASTHKDVKADE